MLTPPIPDQPSRGRRTPQRILFLDDDPTRAAIFLTENPEAVWVQTASQCIARLEETWDEVHLDHDLGGEHFVDLSREDCGMEVVRWLCLEPHPHLQQTRFLVHSHNAMAAEMMAMQIRVAGFRVENRPFGIVSVLPPPEHPFWSERPAWQDWIARRLQAVAALFRDRRDDRLRPPDAPGKTHNRELN